MGTWTTEELGEAIKKLWNQGVGNNDRQLNFKDDHVTNWYLDSDYEIHDPVDAYLYFSVLHAGPDRYWGNRTLEHLRIELDATQAQQFVMRFPITYNFTMWDPELPEKFRIQSQQKPDADKAIEIPAGSFPTRNIEINWPPISTEKVNIPAGGVSSLHQVKLVEIWNPGNQLGYGWKCACSEGLLCEYAATSALKATRSWRDVKNKSGTNSMFSLAIPLYHKVIHRVTVVASEREDWDGTLVPDYTFTIPTGFGDQTRIYTSADWRDGVSNPIYEIRKLIGFTSLSETKDGQLLVKLSEEYRLGRFRSTICSFKDHSYGSNDALRRYLSENSPPGIPSLINAFCLLHKGMCVICATNKEMALMIPSDMM